MALSKTIETKHGVNAAYHKLRKDFSSEGGNLKLVVDSFASAEARQSGKLPLETLRVLVPLTAIFPTLDEPQSFWAALYAAVKAGVAALSDATDC